MPTNTPAAALTRALLLNPADLDWTPTIEGAGDRSPAFALLSSEAEDGLTLLFFRTTAPVRIKPHTHAQAETHVVLRGAPFVFQVEGERHVVEEGGFLRIPGGAGHEAWLPADSLTVNVLEGGWRVDWLGEGPTLADIGVEPPAA